MTSSDSEWRGLKDWQRIFRHELERVAGSQNADDVQKKLTGLALSGGGIRSASFALGVVQALQKYGCLERFHYLSTVSGGGYTGVALSWLRKLYPVSWKRQLVGAGTRRLRATSYSKVNSAKDPPGKGIWLDYLRQHGNYLQPPHIGILSLAGVAIRNLLLSVAVYVGLAAVLLTAFHYAGLYLDQPAAPYGWSASVLGINLEPKLRFDIWSLVATGFAALLLVFVLYSLGSFAVSLSSWREPIGLIILIAVSLVPAFVGSRPACSACSWGNTLVTSALFVAGVFCSAGAMVFSIFRLKRMFNSAPAGDPDLYWLRVYLQRASGWLLILLAFLAMAAALPSLADRLQHHKPATFIALIGSAATTYQVVVAGRRVMPRSIFIQAAIICVFVIVVTSGALTAYYLSDLLYKNSFQMQRVWVFWSFISLLLLISFCTNLNQFGIGRMYRDRLMETFMPDRRSIRRTSWARARNANSDLGLLRNLWTTRASPSCLYPLINTNVVLTTSDSDTFRGRGGDSFVLSPMFCGSDATGWIRTETFADSDFKTGTAMAISGAAANPNTAPGGHGFSRNRLVSFLMFVTQVRLGAWVTNPGFRAPKALAVIMRTIFGQRPNFLFPGVLSGLFGLRLKETSYFIELTDGGHFDNTGVYELIRRRAKLIVLSQASQDGDFWLSDLANLTEKIRVDFNVRLYFGDGMPIQGLLPQKVSDKVRVAMSERGHAIAKIKYGDREEDTGWLVYLQATPLDALAVDVHTYHLQNRAFPNEPTANQFFRETQLEAYRELGYAVTKRFLQDVIDGRRPSSPAAPRACLAHIDDLLNPIEP